MAEQEYQTINKYDRQYGDLMDVAIHTKPSTVKHVQKITGETETFVIQTFRHEEFGDYIFIERIDKEGVVRLPLPPKVANLIASQRDSLTTKRRSIAGKARARRDKEEGKLPGFMRKKKVKVG